MNINTRSLAALSVAVVATMLQLECAGADQLEVFSGHVTFGFGASANAVNSASSGVRSLFAAAAVDTIGNSFPNVVQAEYEGVGVYNGSNLEVRFLASTNSSLMSPVLQTLFRQWSASGGFTPLAAISTDAATKFSISANHVTTTKVDVTHPCRSSGTAQDPTPAPAVSDSCQSGAQPGLKFVLHTLEAKSAQVIVSAVCQASGVASCNTNVVATNVGVSTGDGAFSAEVRFVNVPNALRLLVNTVQKIRSNNFVISNLNARQVILFSADGTTTTTVYDVSQSTTGVVTTGDGGDCPQTLWWLVFLIFILPIMLIAVRHSYRRGKRRGKEQALEGQRYQIEQAHYTAQQITEQQYGGHQQQHQYQHQQQQQQGGDASGYPQSQYGGNTYSQTVDHGQQQQYGQQQQQQYANNTYPHAQN